MAQKETLIREDSLSLTTRGNAVAKENTEFNLRGAISDAKRVIDDIRDQYPPGLHRLEMQLGVYATIHDLQDQLTAMGSPGSASEQQT